MPCSSSSIEGMTIGNNRSLLSPGSSRILPISQPHSRDVTRADWHVIVRVRNGRR